MNGVEDPEQLGVILNIPLAMVNAIGSIVAVFVIDNLGRRQVLLTSLPGLFVALVLVAVSMYYAAR